MTEKLPLKQDRQSQKPETMGDFGLVVWHIIGGKKADMAEAASRLKVSPSFLKAIIRSNQISQQTITQKQWREALARFYPDTWKRYRRAFERGTSALKSKPGTNSRQPEDKNGLGFVLWQILGGETINVGEAAARLNVSDTSLSHIIHGRQGISKKLIDQKQWREAFAQFYPDAWQKRKVAFEQRILAKKAVTRINKDWRTEAGKFVGTLLADKGDEIKDIVSAVKVPELKEVKVWQKIVSGDRTVSPSLGKAALEEMCNVYKLGDAKRPKRLYNKAQRLIKKFE